LYKLAKSLGDFGTAGTPGASATLVATVVAFAVGYVVIIGFLKIVSTYSYKPFVWYRIGLAVVVAALLLTGVLEPLAGAA
jgi:undecaprenyl-diphosphatase